MGSTPLRVVSALVALALLLGSTTAARAQCEVSTFCCYGYPVVTGTVIDGGPDAFALSVDWAGERTEAGVGDVVPLITQHGAVGTRLLAGEVGRPDCISAPTCPFYKIISELDGGNRSCDISAPGNPTLTLSEPDFVALNARADCLEALKTRLRLAERDFCGGALPNKCECRAVDAPTHGSATPILLATALVALALARAHARRRARDKRDAGVGGEREHG